MESIRIRPNPYPSLTPDELWEANQRWLACEDTKKKKELGQAYKKLRSRYEYDKLTGHFIKDDNGNFIKTQAVKDGQ